MTLTVPPPTRARQAVPVAKQVARAAAGEVWWWLSVAGRLGGRHPWRTGGFVLVCVVLSWQDADVLLLVVV